MMPFPYTGTHPQPAQLSWNPIGTPHPRIDDESKRTRERPEALSWWPRLQRLVDVDLTTGVNGVF